MAAWDIIKTDVNIELMSKTLSISKQLSTLLANRNIRTKKTALGYLSPKFDQMHDIAQIPDAVKAFGMISKYKKTAVYGDYDADGVISTVILCKALAQHGIDICYYIPHREEEGYGLNCEAVKTLAENDVNLLICCDNGISALEEVKYAKELGMEVIIIDHHEPSFVYDPEGVKHDVIPLADAVVDPKIQNCPYPFKELCAGGLAYKFVEGFYKYTETDFHMRDEFLVLAMIATFCDIVDLLGENRIITKAGLEILNANKRINTGLWALINARGYDAKEINEYAVGFIIGPCINATGRLARADTAIDLLLEDDPYQAGLMAQTLVELNEERKKLTATAVEKALESCQPTDKVIIVHDDTIHESVAGIVAGRIKDALYRPTIVLTSGSGIVKGSARSIEGYNMFEELYACRDLFLRFGGHTMAAGLSIRKENIEAFRERLLSACQLTADDLVPKVKYDMELSLKEITYPLCSDISNMMPFGKANRQPLFAVRNIAPEQIKVIADKDTFLLTFVVPENGRWIKAICFGMIERFYEELTERLGAFESEKIMHGILRNPPLMDLLITPEFNEYNGNVSIQMKIKDFIIK